MYEKVKLLPIYLLVIITMGFAGVGKLIGNGVPEWFTGAFGATFLAKVPGLTISYYSIALLETACAALAVFSLCKQEFQPKSRKPWLKWSLFLTALSFVQLGFGQRLLADHNAAASLFFYFAGTIVMLGYVEAQERI